MSKPIQEAHLLVKKTQQEVNRILGPEHVHNLLGINALFDQIGTRFTFMGSVLEPKKGDVAANEFGPITNFMGEELTATKPITSDDLSPKEAEKKVYLAKLEQLWDSLPNTDPLTILNNYTLPEDIAVLRGVAKRAGIKDYADRKLNVDFIEDIILGIGIVEENRDKTKKIDDHLRKTEFDKDLYPLVLTDEMIAKDPDLVALKAKAGDSLIIYKDGTKTIGFPDSGK